MVVVVDAGPLITLGKLGQLDLLNAVADSVLVPPAVFAEVVLEGERRGRTDALAVRRALHQGRLRLSDAPTVALGNRVDALGLGEREAIQIALDQGADAVLLDDLAARQHAAQLGLSVFGSLGVLVRVFRRQAIERDDLEALLQAIRRRPDIWISSSLVDGVLVALDELDLP